MRSSGSSPGDFIYIDVKFCADFESAKISSIRWLVFALSFKEGTISIISRQKVRFLGTKRVRFARVFKLGRIRLHHVKERKKTRLVMSEPRSRWIGFMDL